MEKISVIVPVYNVEKYLNKCIDSIINQTYKNLEIILVDDGSTDSSGEICNQYAKKDDRIKVIHKVNGGLSDARNKGIEVATGEYISFIDSDDYIVENMYEKLISDMTKYNADMVMCRLIDCYGTIPELDKNENVKLLDVEESIKIVLEAQITSVTVVNKLYNKKIFNELKFPKGKTSEDAYIMIDIIMKCKKIVLDMSQLYYYIHRESSITTGKFNNITGYDPIKAYEKNYETIKNNYPNLLNLAKMRVIWANFTVLDRMLNSNMKADNNIVEYLRGNLKFVLCNNCFTISRKISAIALKLNIKLYKLCLNLFNKKNRKLYSNGENNEENSNN